LQLDAVPHRGVQYPLPWLSAMQYCERPSAVGAQSWSSWQGAQYARGMHTVRVFPNVAFVVVTFGESFTVAHHQLLGQSLSARQPNCVQKAFASVGEIP
jgi:hypothetical protein